MHPGLGEFATDVLVDRSDPARETLCLVREGQNGVAVTRRDSRRLSAAGFHFPNSNTPGGQEQWTVAMVPTGATSVSILSAGHTVVLNRKLGNLMNVDSVLCIAFAGFPMAQQARLTARDSRGRALDSTQIVYQYVS